MNKKLTGLLFLAFASIGFVGCIDQENTIDAIFERDKKAIEEYIEASSIVNVREVEDVRGVTVIWQELSGSGKSVFPTDTIITEYTGRLLTDEVFDTSIEAVARENNIFDQGRRYEPLRFPVGNNLVIPGFELGLSFMEEGDKATIFIASEVGYAGNPPVGIPLDAPLIFEVELVNIIEGPRN